MIKQGVNIREIAKIAGVSVASVSRALKSEPSPKLSEKQRKHIRDICAKLHYCPNEHTRRMFSHRANTAAIFFPPFGKISDDMETCYIDVNFGSCLMGLQTELRARGLDLLLTEISPDFLKDKRYLNMIRGKLVDGILVWGAFQDDDYLHELKMEKIPVVQLQNRVNDSGLSAVIADDRNGMKQLAEKVVSSGHTRIAVAAPPSDSSTGKERLDGILETLAGHGIVPYLTRQSGYGYQFGRHAAQEILSEFPGVTCILNSNDMAAFGCIDELKSRGLAVPDDISVTGADGLKLPGRDQIVDSYFSPSFEIGRKGGEILHRLIEGGEPELLRLDITPVQGSTIRKIQG